MPDEVDSTTTYKYLLTASAENAEDASAEVMVTVLDGAPLSLDDAIAGRVYIFTVGEVIEDILLPQATGGLPPYTYTLEPVLPRGLRLKVDDDTTRTISGTPLEVSPRTEYIWQVDRRQRRDSADCIFHRGGACRRYHISSHSGDFIGVAGAVGAWRNGKRLGFAFWSAVGGYTGVA